MKRSFVVFWKRNLAFFKLAIVSNLEYRLNYFFDAIVSPILGAMIEILLWTGIFKTAKHSLIGGFSVDYYLSYAIWASFFARISVSWMYEFKMIDDISSGSLNILLTRPMSFFEYYLFQLLGYKFITTIFSLIVPIAVCSYFNLPFSLIKMGLSVALCFYFILLIHSISFLISTAGFYFTKISSFTVAKNLALWIFTGELLPFDLIPHGLREIFITLPFSSGVYLPVAYLTNRIPIEMMYSGFISISVGIVIINILAWPMWWRGLRSYTGIGA